MLRNGAFPVDHPPPHTALVVWPYLTWRAYNSYDADLNGIPDSWYHFWRNRRVSLRGAIVPGGQEDDYKAALPFSQWLCERHPRVQSVTDVELGRLPLSVLRRYRAIVFPGHSEYYEPHTWKLLRDYRDHGGHLAFLQANPFYRQVKLVKDRNAMVMTDFDARDRGYSDFALAGVGYDGCCFPKSRAARYVSATGAAYTRVRWLFRGTGIGPGQAFGYAGSESDRIDPELSPPGRVVAAEAVIPGNYGVGERGARLVAGGARRGVRDRQLQLPENAEGSHVDAARQRLAQAGLVAVALLAGCGSSAAAAQGRPAARAARAAADARPGEGGRHALAERDARALRGPDPLLGARSRSRSRGVVGRSSRAASSGSSTCARTCAGATTARLTAQDVRRSWLRALSPATGAPLAGPDLGIVRGARAYHASGRGRSAI